MVINQLQSAAGGTIKRSF